MTTTTYHVSKTDKRTGTRVVALVTVRQGRLFNEVLSETIVVAGPEGTRLGATDVHNTVRFERNDGLDTDYKPARWLAGSYGHFRTIAEMAEKIGSEVADGTLLRVLHPEAFGAK